MKLPSIDRREANVHLTLGAVAVLLVLLLLLTPTLEGGFSVPPGPLLSRGVLYVDYLGNNTLIVYLESYGHVRFSQISFGVNLSAGNFSAGSPMNLRWDYWENATNHLVYSVTVNTSADFALNVSATYVNNPPTSSAYSYGTYGFLLSLTPGGGTLTAYPLGNLPTSQEQVWSLSQLPQALVLSETTYSGVRA
ncbi:MAG: hypothetical protein M1144_02540 [Candidatus Thermoplasmatota archaeon]|jgi:hypothetical protein|nr:hypothetical protein [Candidatus Thermoplasmatota archaeon]